MFVHVCLLSPEKYRNKNHQDAYLLCSKWLYFGQHPCAPIKARGSPHFAAYTFAFLKQSMGRIQAYSGLAPTEVSNPVPFCMLGPSKCKWPFLSSASATNTPSYIAGSLLFCLLEFVSRFEQLLCEGNKWSISHCLFFYWVITPSCRPLPPVCLA